jgi:hypothetical protein
MNISIGTCSICGGRVTVPKDWMCIFPPTPTCESCGAIAAEHGPVIPMNPRTPIRTGTTTGNPEDFKGWQGSSTGTATFTSTGDKEQ